MLPQIDAMIGFSVVMLLLSLLITILVQVTVDGLNLRGRNLLWGVTVILEQALPSLKSRAPELARAVLDHPSLSLGKKVKATAIRSDELIAVLALLAEDDEALRDQIVAARAALTHLDATAPLQKLLEEAFPDQPAKIAAVMSKARAEALKDVEAIRAWYDTVMDRTSERFARWTRVITAALAVAIAFGLPVDAVALFKQVSTSADLRARLTQSAEATIKMADDVSRREGLGRTLAADALTTAKRNHPEVTAAVDRDLATRGQGSHWILANVPADVRPAFSQDYESAYDAELAPLAKELMVAAASVKAQLGETQLVMVPAVRPELTWKRLLGMAISALFLCLGAPFWFNVLQQIGNLRPLLAGKVDDTESSKGPGAASG